MKEPTRFKGAGVVHAVKLCTRGRTWLYAPCGAQDSAYSARQDGKIGPVTCEVCLAWLREQGEGGTP